MKTEQYIRAGLESKQADLEKARARVAEIDAWIEANNFFGTKQPATFLEKLLTEKIGAEKRVIQLETQVRFLEWVLE